MVGAYYYHFRDSAKSCVRLEQDILCERCTSISFVDECKACMAPTCLGVKEKSLEFIRNADIERQHDG